MESNTRREKKQHLLLPEIRFESRLVPSTMDGWMTFVSSRQLGKRMSSPDSAIGRSIIIIADCVRTTRWRFWKSRASCRERLSSGLRSRRHDHATQRPRLKPINSNKTTLIALVNCSIQRTTELLRKHYRIIVRWNFPLSVLFLVHLSSASRRVSS